MAVSTEDRIRISSNCTVDLLAKLGQGAFGTVYRGERKDGTPVAIKQITSDSMEETMDGMEEIKILQKLTDHANVVKFHDFHFLKKSFWLVMEFCDGGDLENYFKKVEGKLDIAVKVDFMHQLANGVKHLHDSKLVHRDLKPGNTLISYQTGVAVLK
ncbi:unnamed protein product, partial [Owenia fusiformis]